MALTDGDKKWLGESHTKEVVKAVSEVILPKFVELRKKSTKIVRLETRIGLTAD